MFLNIIAALAQPVKTIGEVIQNRQEAKVREKELEAVRHEKTVEAVRSQDALEIQADMERSKGLEASWKDEFVLGILTIPLVMCFIPDYAPVVQEGFVALSGTPDWFQYLVVAVYCVSAGVPMANKTVSTIQSIIKPLTNK